MLPSIKNVTIPRNLCCTSFVAGPIPPIIGQLEALAGLYIWGNNLTGDLTQRK